MPKMHVVAQVLSKSKDMPDYVPVKSSNSGHLRQRPSDVVVGDVIGTIGTIIKIDKVSGLCSAHLDNGEVYKLTSIRRG